MKDYFDIGGGEVKLNRLRRRLPRIVAPIAFVILMMAAILVISLISYHNNRRDALSLSEDLLRSLDRRIATEVRTFLLPASDMVNILDSTMKEGAYWSNRRQLAEPLATQMLRAIPQLAIFSFADPKGNYIMLKKMPDQSIHTKYIQRTETGVEATWIRRSPDGREIEREVSANDDFDPRQRPWYLGAIETSGVHWTDVYIFFTDQKPGITASKAFRDPNGQLLAVVGVDMELEKLSEFLASLEVGRNGRAMIIDESGHLVAYPEISQVSKLQGETLELSRLDELNDPALARAYNRFLIEKEGYRELSVGEEKYINTVSSLQETVGKNWFVSILVPAEDFVGFVSRNNRKAMLMSIVVLALAAGLAGLLIWQGLRADRNAALLLLRKSEMEAQARAFSDLAAKSDIFDPSNVESLKEITRITAEAVGIRRVGVWEWRSGGRRLVCRDCYDRESGGHDSGIIFLQEDFPHLFQALIDEEVMNVEDSTNDPRTAEIDRVYLNPLGCKGLLSIQISDEDKVHGALWFEHEGVARQWRPEELSFARAVGGLLALRMSVSAGRAICETESDVEGRAEREALLNGDLESERKLGEAAATAGTRPLTHVAPAMRETAIADRRAQVFNRRMKESVSRERTIGADVYEEASVLVLQLLDPIALAEQLDGEYSTTAVDSLVCKLEELASESGVEYMKLMGEQVVCAAGIGGNNATEHRRAVIELAIQIRDVCLGIFEKSEKMPEFRIGIDTGAVIGSMVGHERKTYNLWGEALKNAEKMAESGTTGEIYVSESTCRGLRKDYLFKARGTYYLPNIGELTTFILLGRL